jgi:hypothetical protein
MKNIFLLFITFTSLNLFAFPDMIRHGYVNCTACHISPSGGGVLTPYGRSLSKELLSTWSYEKEENILHGLVDTEKVNDWLAIGGDIRNVQVHVENDLVTRGKFIKMQAGIELGINVEKFALIGFFGEYIKDEWVGNSPRYYGLYRATDTVSLKAGRFIPNFGINFSEHIFATRGYLGFGYGTEKDSVEVSYLSDQWNFTGTYFKTPKEKSSFDNKGYAATASFIFNEKNKITAQHYQEKNDIVKNTITGLNGLLGWNEHFYTTIEYDRLRSEPVVTTPATDGDYFTHKTGYEATKGLHFILLNDYVQTDIKDGSTKDYKYGPGIQWYPRPHLDLQFFWTKQQASLNTAKEGDYAWLVLHYYL